MQLLSILSVTRRSSCLALTLRWAPAQRCQPKALIIWRRRKRMQANNACIKANHTSRKVRSQEHEQQESIRPESPSASPMKPCCILWSFRNPLLSNYGLSGSVFQRRWKFACISS
ncbi:hypothetical protein J3F83DRAFT_720102 [Trichoderma novae-zelandiae]